MTEKQLVWIFLTRFLTLTLMLDLSVSQPVFALRPGSGMDDPSSSLRTGLEERLRSVVSGQAGFVEGASVTAGTEETIEVDPLKGWMREQVQTLLAWAAEKKVVNVELDEIAHVEAQFADGDWKEEYLKNIRLLEFHPSDQDHWIENARAYFSYPNAYGSTAIPLGSIRKISLAGGSPRVKPDVETAPPSNLFLNDLASDREIERTWEALRAVLAENQRPLLGELAGAPILSLAEAHEQFLRADASRVSMFFQLKGFPDKESIQTLKRLAVFNGEVCICHIRNTDIWVAVLQQVGRGGMQEPGSAYAKADRLYKNLASADLLDVEFHNHPGGIVRQPSAADIGRALHKGGRNYLITPKGFVLFSVDRIVSPGKVLFWPPSTWGEIFTFEATNLGMSIAEAISSDWQKEWLEEGIFPEQMRNFYERIRFDVAPAIPWEDISGETFSPEAPSLLDQLRNPSPQIRIWSLGRLQDVYGHIPRLLHLRLLAQFALTDPDPAVRSLVYERLAESMEGFLGVHSVVMRIILERISAPPGISDRTPQENAASTGSKRWSSRLKEWVYRLLGLGTGLEEKVEVRTVRKLEGSTDLNARRLAQEAKAAGYSHVVLIPKALSKQASFENLVVTLFAQENVVTKAMAVLTPEEELALRVNPNYIPSQPEKIERFLREHVTEQIQTPVVALDVILEKDIDRILPADHPLTLLLDSKLDGENPLMPYRKALATLLSNPPKEGLRNLILRLTKGTVQTVTIEGIDYVAIFA